TTKNHYGVILTSLVPPQSRLSNCYPALLLCLDNQCPKNRLAGFQHPLETTPMTMMIFYLNPLAMKLN
ncbi:hypothetical protein HDU80_003362, partial [Chytriomyces hyalinus]